MGSWQLTSSVYSRHRAETTTGEMRKFLIAVALITQVLSSPLPQDPNDDAEVFGGPVRTNTDYESDYVPGGFGFPRVRVVVVPIGSPDYEDSQPSFPSSGTSFRNVFNILRSILSSGRPVLPSSDEDKEGTDSDTPERPCFVCSFFKNSFKDVQDHINTVRDKQNEIDFDASEDGLAINNSTHTTKVLEDGSVVHINKTVIADTDEDGNSFFSHRAVFHNIGNSEDSEEDDSMAEDEEQTEVTELVGEETEEDFEAGVDDGLIA